MKRIGIIGAGRFGMALSESLANAGFEVILIDRTRPAMQAANEFATALQGDARSRGCWRRRASASATSWSSPSAATSRLR